ncbi:hypothetical protein K0B96_15665 [Horticoccus luteus]|uniref:Uncharacterized protein n=1 Tax=Horticoccus luteus TaxID=2862869 RepID=A0A8F9TT34_9BACT|nr:hypothetical protein [Horticoccus luteus]QYM78719.1 hypothetical protein K0B96_15665 [Horticoccus luteus]
MRNVLGRGCPQFASFVKSQGVRFYGVFVDVFVSGPTHELLPTPTIVPGTGARIVQAGYYARWVGRLELTVDLETRKVIEAAGEAIPMRHDRTPVDAAMLAWVRQRESELCPEASDVLVKDSGMLTMNEVAWLGAAALRRQAKTDVGFCHAGQGHPQSDLPGTARRQRPVPRRRGSRQRHGAHGTDRRGDRGLFAGVG